MSNIFGIYKRDLKNIFSNYGALIVVIAMCILPSLYAWFNIKASWDPYSQEATSQIKIGVVNNDNGTELNGSYINIGDKVIDELKNNDLMGWQFTDYDDAYKRVEDGEYYAMISIPENFSYDITSILRSDIKKGQIDYIVNEKINAIAPKLTDKGATGVQANISKTIVSTVSDAIFGAANDIGITLESELPRITRIYDMLLSLQSQYDEIDRVISKGDVGIVRAEEIIERLNEYMPALSDAADNAKELSEGTQEFLITSKEALNNIAPSIKQDIKLIGDIASDINEKALALKDAVNASSDKVPAIIDSLINKTSSLQAVNRGVIKILQSINNIQPSDNLTNVINKLQTIDNAASTVISILNDMKTNGVDVSKIDNVIGLTGNISSICSTIYNNFDDTVLGSINSILDKAYEGAGKAGEIITAAKDKLPEAQDFLSKINEALGKGKEGIEYVKKYLPDAESAIDDLVAKMKDINDKNGLQEIIDILKSDVEMRSNFLANPVELKEEKLFPIPNYGTGMTPFYTVLSLWVGILLLTSIFTAEAHGEYRSWEVYFGKLLLFMSVTIIQGIIVSLGDLYLLKVYCVNPSMFIIGCILTSIVFTFIVYSLVSVFGNVGKVISIILLVLQVAGSGGTFPIQLVPRFFQIINPYLPFTYCISFAREAIGGAVQRVVMKDILAFGIYIGLSLIIALVLKNPINKMSEGFVESFKKSGIGE